MLIACLKSQSFLFGLEMPVYHSLRLELGIIRIFIFADFLSNVFGTHVVQSKGTCTFSCLMSIPLKYCVVRRSRQL